MAEGLDLEDFKSTLLNRRSENEWKETRIGHQTFYHEKYILFDGLSHDRTFDECIQYDQYKAWIKSIYSDFKVIEFKECIYFRNMIKGFSKISLRIYISCNLRIYYIILIFDIQRVFTDYLFM